MYGSFGASDVENEQPEKADTEKFVHFIGIARITQYKRVYILSYFSDEKMEVDKKSIKEVLARPNLNLTSGSFFSFPVDSSVWHLTLGLMFDTN